VFDWLEDVPVLPEDKQYVEVRFKNTRKDYFENPNRLRLKQGDIVAVEAMKGHDIGIVSLTGPLVYSNMKKRNINYKNTKLKKIYRFATPNDIEKWKEAIALEYPTMLKTRKIIKELGLEMKLSDVEYQGDKTKATFYYIADERVDFRELIKVLAKEFKIRVEMRQIGARQEAGLIGGIGPCGKELCCTTWMSNFVSVTTATARTQELTINIQKLTGLCGKLKCCLNFELPVYEEAREYLPDITKPLVTDEGNAVYLKSDVFKKIVWYVYDTEDNKGIFPLSYDSVEFIQEKNKRGERIEKLEDFTIKHDEENIDFVVSQHTVEQMESKRRQNKKNKKRNKRKRN
jgi:cell fate regulator YaaT (PSP1 superfamily)